MIEELAIPGVLRVTPRRFSDDRGWFSETYNARTLKSHGLDVTFVQDNQSFSAKPGTIRGFHLQKPPHAQAKLVRCIRGRIVDIAVDVRPGSPTHGKWVAEELSPENGIQLFIPVGFLHAFITLTADTEVAYKVSDFYAPECEAGIRWDDPTIGFPWRLPPDGPFLSAKDAGHPFLSDVSTPFS